MGASVPPQWVCLPAWENQVHLGLEKGPTCPEPLKCLPACFVRIELGFWVLAFPGLPPQVGPQALPWPIRSDQVKCQSARNLTI